MRGLWDNQKTDCAEEGGHDERDVGCPSPAKIRLCDEATDAWLAGSRNREMMTYPIIGPAIGPRTN